MIRLFKTACFSLFVLVLLSGCSLFGSSDDNNNNTNGEESTETETTKYNLSASSSPSEGGLVSPASGSFEENATVSVEANANEGWVFTSWTGDRETSENPLEFTITEDTELIANFEDQRSVYTMELKATNITDTLTLHFGQAVEGTDAFDQGLDEEWPPMGPPSGELNASFLINDLTLADDFRDNLETQVEWILNYQVGSGDDFKLEWKLTDDTKISGSLTLTDENNSFEVDMLSQSSHTISGSTSGKLQINYSFN